METFGVMGPGFGDKCVQRLVHSTSRTNSGLQNASMLLVPLLCVEVVWEYLRYQCAVENG